MDIIVTTPKTAMSEAAAEAKVAKQGILAGTDVVYTRSLGRNLPNSLDQNDRVFYVEDGFIRGYAVVLREPYRSREEPHRAVVMLSVTSWKWIRPIAMRGFRGWRYSYIDPDVIEVVGNWLDPKPA